MITHRMSTQPLEPEPQTRWYKAIAFIFLFVTVVLLGAVVFITSKKADITVIAKEDSEPISVTVTVNSQKQGDAIIPGTVTSTVYAHTEKYHPTGNKKVDAVATGEVVVYNKTSEQRILVQKTRLLAPDGTLFRMSQKVSIPANGQATVPVYADKAGKTGDIAPTSFTIPGLPEDQQKVVYAESKAAFSGGEQSIGVLTNDDLKTAEEAYKKHIVDSFTATIGTSTNLKDERLVRVGDAKINFDHKAGDEVSEVTVSGTSTIVVVTYNSEELANYLDRALENKIDNTAERFLTADTQPQVSLKSVNAKDGTADLSVKQDVKVTLDANVEKLAPHNFFGKKKTEIEQYISSLDHVAGVTVKFSPSWMLSAPTVPDKIHIVVRNMQ